MLTNQEFDELVDRVHRLAQDGRNGYTGIVAPSSELVDVPSCGDTHSLVEVGTRQEVVNFTNKYNTPLRGFRVYARCKCLKCDKELEFLKI